MCTFSILDYFAPSMASAARGRWAGIGANWSAPGRQPEGTCLNVTNNFRVFLNLIRVGE
jgi:hypothetical protein